MANPRVFEFAKEVGLETLALMDKIREWQLPVKNHMVELDPDTLELIRSRLKESSAKSKAAKLRKTRTAVRVKTGESSSKAETEKKSKSDSPKKPTKKTVGSKGTKTKDVSPKKPPRPKKTAGDQEPAADILPVRKASPQTVIRRKMAIKASEMQAEALGADKLTPEAESGYDGLDAELRAVGGALEAKESSTGLEEVGKAEAKGLRRNIVGKMDLTRPKSSDGVEVRFPRTTANRNIRTGFVAPPSMESFIEQQQQEEEKKRVEEKLARKRLGKEAPQAHFLASDFRKREMVFQPRKRKLSLGRDAKKTEITQPKASKRVIRFLAQISVADLAHELGVKVAQLTKILMQNGVMATPAYLLDFETVALIVPEFGFEAVNLVQSSADLVKDMAFGEVHEEPVPRPPVVTVMGHVDHGKTTLLDAIRNADVVSSEAGGITQHIAAYSVEFTQGRSVTFIDTPGHEAFTAMRARGANVTDIAIIVVAADDGVMPQTIEAIRHAQSAQVPLIVAVNKIDRANANVDRVKQQLTEHQVVPEEWGGTTIFCEVSALKKQGIKELLEQAAVLAEVMDLKANPRRSGTGVVLESRLDRGRGHVATILVKDGTVHVGDWIVAGFVSGKIRNMVNDKGQVVSQAGPSIPVEILGLQESPQAGDLFDICKSEEIAQQIMRVRRQESDLAVKIPSSPTLEDIFAKIKKGGVNELPIVLKTDVAGSMEAIKGMLNKLGNEEVKVKLIHSAIGGINESDVLLAAAARGLVVGFNVRPDTGARSIAKEKSVEINCYTVVYELLDELKKALSGLLAPEVVEKVVGRAEVRETFSVPKVGTVAGCSVVEGKILRNSLVRLLRDGTVVYQGKLGSLRRFKEDVREVAMGFECGIGVENYNDIKNGDVIEAYSEEQIERVL